MKRFIVLLLIFLTLNFCSVPLFAKSKDYITIKAEFLTDLNINDAKNNQSLEFKSVEDASFNEYIIPKGTIFKAKIKNVRKSAGGYKRAKANFRLDEVIFPNGRIFYIDSDINGNEIKSSNNENIKHGFLIAYRVPLLTALSIAGTTATTATVIVPLIDSDIIFEGFFDGIENSYNIGTEGANFVRHKGEYFKFKIKVKQKDIREFTEYEQ